MQNPTSKPLTVAEWRRTPYATSEAKDPDKAISGLLEKYRVKNIQFTSVEKGPNGRRAFEVRFQLRDRVYRVGMEILSVRGVDEGALVRQVKRAVFRFLKIALEFATVFCPLDQVLFGFVETASGRTTYDQGREYLQHLLPGHFYPPPPASPALPPHTPAGGPTT